MIDANETWIDIKDYEGIYQISNYGRILSLRIVNNYNKPRIKKSFISSSEYYSIQLNNGIKIKTFLLHRLLAQHFIPNPLNYDFINHKDGNKLNNNLDNLEWCSRKQNVSHAVKTGLVTNKHRMGGKIPENLIKKMSKIDKKTADIIREEYKTGKFFYKHLAEKYGISDSQIGAIINNQSWI